MLHARCLWNVLLDHAWTDTATNFGFTAVIFFLFLGQRFVATAFFTDFIADVLGQFLANVSLTPLAVTVIEVIVPFASLYT